MKLFSLMILVITLAPSVAAEPTKLVASGFANATGLCVGPEGRIFVSESGKPDVLNDGRILSIEHGKPSVFAEKLDDPRGLVYFRFQKAFYTTDGKTVVKIDAKGKATVFVSAEKFPKSIDRLSGLSLEETSQSLLVAGNTNNNRGAAVFKIDLRKGGVEVLAETTDPTHKVTAVAFDGATHGLFAMGSKLIRIRFADRAVETVREKIHDISSIFWDHHGQLFLTANWTGGRCQPRPGSEWVNFEMAKPRGPACYDPAEHRVVYITELDCVYETSAQMPGWEVDMSLLEIAFEPAFPKLKWTGWDDGSDSGRVGNHRPIFLTHAGDGTNRIFAGLQQGTIHVFENNDAATTTKVFLDLSKKVRYLDKQNEEGLLGLAFHPDYKTNGQFFVFYTEANAKQTNVVSRLKVKADDPNMADPASEEVLLKIEKPYWNHDGGTIAFGPDGYLYITHGDGGLGGDPHENGQSLKTHLGKILRIDINKKSNNKNYGIPVDNPFASQADALPEIYAYGLRNVWRMAFDRKTGALWAGEVGQNLYEEINIIQKGGNYGWSVRESLHPFGKQGVGHRERIIDPIWEYHHDIGKSITGGHVYRGANLPLLQGLYLYADYVTPRVWALRYDEAKKRVIGNHSLGVPGIAVMSFGEDERGETYIMGASTTGRGIYRLAKR